MADARGPAGGEGRFCPVAMAGVVRGGVRHGGIWPDGGFMAAADGNQKDLRSSQPNLKLSPAKSAGT
jgi:hypothetical protein